MLDTYFRKPGRSLVGGLVHVGKKWTLEIAKLENGKIAGYVTDAFSAHTVAVNDENHRYTVPLDGAYTAPTGFKVPKTVMLKLKRLMRKAGWVEDTFAKLKPDYIHELAAKGNGMRLPAEYANISLARLYFVGDVNHEMYVEHYKVPSHAYNLWVGLPKGVRCAMRNAGEKSPVYQHDLVDKH